MLFQGICGNQLFLFSYKDLNFGLNFGAGIKLAEFPLVGVYNLSFKTLIDGWIIESSRDKNELLEIQSKSRNWGLQLEGNIIRLAKHGASKEEYLRKIIDIALLLSLATGNDIAFNRQLYYQENNAVYEEWRRRVDYNFGAEGCIPNFKIDEFLKQTIPVVENWNADKKKVFSAAINYINSSSKGYLEDRLLRIGIAWEALAYSWGSKNNAKKTNAILPLKKKLKEAVNNHELPENFDREFLISRVLGSLDWDRNTRKLIEFANKYNLDFVKLGLDFPKLNNIRNAVAHTGFFKEKESNEILSNLLFDHKTGLQILLLIELGYNDLIEGRGKIIKIKELLK